MNLYDAGVVPLIDMLGNMAGWLQKATAAGVDEAKMMQARLAPDMHPFPRQFQIASDMAKNGGARLAGVEPPPMPDTESDFAQLQQRCLKTAEFLRGLDRAAIDAAEGRSVDLNLANGVGFGFTGAEYAVHWVLPNVYFHATTAYALLRSNGVELGKADFMASGLRFMKSPPA